MVLENRDLHIDTIATRLITHGYTAEVRFLASRLNDIYDEPFLKCVSESEEGDNKRKCLELYLIRLKEREQ